MTRTVDAQEFLHGFLAEADENLARITGNLAAIERDPARTHARELGELFRALHTLKGLAGMMGVEPIVQLAHAMESRVREAQRADARLPAAALDPLLAGARAIAQRVRAVADHTTVADAPESVMTALAQRDEPGAAVGATTQNTLPALDPALREKLGAAELAELAEADARGEQVMCLRFVPSPEKAARGESITQVRAGIEPIARIVRVLPRSVARDERAPGGLEFLLLLVTRAQPAALLAAAKAAPDDLVVVAASDAPLPAPAPIADEDVADDALDRATRKGIVRVDVARLDVAVELLAAVGNGRARMQRALVAMGEAGVDVRALLRGFDDEARALRRLRAELMGLRMVALREVLEPLPLILRGLRGSTGKRVELTLDVGEVELDKSVGERILPALIHLVRNAVDHGIEDTATRRARGKPEHGTVVVRANASAGASLELVIADDGGGIDVAEVARRSRKPVPPDFAGLLDLLTAPGFSTRDAVSTTSGRGLGLDIVRRTIEGLGGTLALEHRPGHGTTWRLHAPLSVALVDAFACESAAQRYLVPVGAVEAIVDVDASALIEPPAADRDARALGLLSTRGRMVPLVALHDVLGVRSSAATHKAMLVELGTQTCAFGVDRMLGRHEVIVRPLADPLVHVAGVSGSADLGDGQPTLVLDLRVLGSRLGRGHRQELHA